MKSLISALLFLFFLSACFNNSVSAQQVDSDTLYYDLEKEKIEQVGISDGPTGYMLTIVLEEELHKEYAELTEEHVGYVLAVGYEDEILAAPVIRSRIEGGRINIPIEEKEEAEELKQELMDTSSNGRSINYALKLTCFGLDRSTTFSTRGLSNLS